MLKCKIVKTSYTQETYLQVSWWYMYLNDSYEIDSFALELLKVVEYLQFLVVQFDQYTKEIEIKI